jgi:hypothetical protein
MVLPFERASLSCARVTLCASNVRRGRSLHRRLVNPSRASGALSCNGQLLA